jgi:hypothetical protein
MDYSKKIKNLKGDFFPKSFPTTKELESLPKKDVDGENVPDRDKLEKETIGNVIISVLAQNVSKDKRDGFYCNLIADSVLNGGKKAELKDKLRNFLIECLENAELREVDEENEKGKNKKVVKGVYPGWIIAQVLSELGVDPEK